MVFYFIEWGQTEKCNGLPISQESRVKIGVRNEDFLLNLILLLSINNIQVAERRLEKCVLYCIVPLYFLFSLFWLKFKEIMGSSLGRGRVEGGIWPNIWIVLILHIIKFYQLCFLKNSYFYRLWYFIDFLWHFFSVHSSIKASHYM